MHTDKIIIYTDGAARGNPGKGGWGAIVIDGKKIHEIGGRADNATNNQMELSAPIGALKHLKKIKYTGDVEIFSDSKYVINGITDWILKKKKNNWRNAAKKPVLNKELWEELHDLVQGFKIKWTYVKGHAGVEYNERADVIATSFADDEIIELIQD